MKKVLLTLCAVLALPIGLVAQRTPSGQSPDNVVTLLSAQSAELMEVRGQSIRKVVGPARFYHNKTYLICDTAYWNVDDQLIKAIGHVKIVQNQTQLTSETLDYVVEENMAKFRGAVQLEDKDKNVLRTRYLDYNTKDSIAVFQDGGAMKDKDGQIIESRFGSYESKVKTFTFMDNVNMYTDETLIKTSRLVYNSETNLATFGYGTDVWNGTDMMSAHDGWFDRGRDWFFFRKNVHIQTEDREGWSDSLLYKRPVTEVEMLGNAQILDTTRNLRVLAGRIFYQDTLSRVTMTRRPVIENITEEGDTVYVGADTLMHQSIPRCEVDSLEVVVAQKRLKDLAMDPVAEYRRKAAEEAAKAAEEAAKNDPNHPPELPGKKPGATGTPPARDGGKAAASAPENTLTAPSDSIAAPADTVSVPSDSLAAPSDSLAAPADSLSAPADTLAVPADTLAAPADSVPPAPKDSTKIDFVWAWGKVKLFRKDIQMASDSLAYNGLDSLVRVYREPFVFHEGNRQYTADSIYVATRNNSVEKASLMSNAFILIQEDSLYYDQIKGAEMLAYFDSTGALRRFDGLGGSSALFYLEENNAIATTNKVDAKMLSATFKDGEIERILYFDSAKNDAYPVVQLPPEEQRMKGFNWNPELRPTGLQDMTELRPRASERQAYAARQRPDYPQSEIYFPGYMKQVLKDLETRKNRPSRQRQPDRNEAMEPGGQEESPGDTLSTAPVDSVSAPDSGLQPSDTLSAPVDSAAVTPSDTVAVSDSTNLSPEELKAKKKAEKERIKAEKQAAREAHWAELDRRDAEKAAAKKQKKLEKKRKATLKALQREAARAAKEKKIYEKYLRRYREKEAKAASSDR